MSTSDFIPHPPPSLSTGAPPLPYRGYLMAAGVMVAAAAGAAVWQGQWWPLLPSALAGAMALHMRRQALATRRDAAHLARDTAARRQASERAAAAQAEDTQVRRALDVSRTAMMIADTDHVIRYVNQSVVRLLRNQQASLREAFPDFDADHLVGTSIHRFHVNPDRIRGILDTLQQVHHGRVRIGPVHFAQVVTPMFGENGQRLGFAVEWHDRTEELRLETAVADIVAAAAQGNLSQRLSASNTGASFLDGLAGGINQLLDGVGGTLGEVRRVLSAFARGDLDQRMRGTYDGDFASMQRDVDALAEQLTGMAGRIKQCSGAISTAAREIASGNSDLSERTERQAAHLEETAATLEELTATVRQNAAHAAQANTLAGTALQVASQGSDAVGRMVETMATIEQASSRIGDITQLIDGIAFQTNILALNAAVEAARAGEQGRGFAVVAAEVRILAQRSAEAAGQIKRLIDDAGREVATGARQAQDAGQTMREVVGGVAGVSGIMAEISSASQEQAAGIDQVNKTVAQLDEATQQNAALVEEANAAARVLEGQASELGEAVAVFQYTA